MSALVWDTTLASRLRPGSPLLDAVYRQASAGERVGITTISLLELSYGMRTAAEAGCDIATPDFDHFTAIAGCINAIVPEGPPLEIVAGPAP